MQRDIKKKSKINNTLKLKQRKRKEKICFRKKVAQSATE